MRSGESLAHAERLDMREDSGVSRPGGAVWMLRGVTSCGSGFWGSQRPSLADYVAMTEAHGRGERRCWR